MLTGFILGAVTVYVAAFVIVFREREEYANRTGADISPLRIALLWPLAIGKKW